MTNSFLVRANRGVDVSAFLAAWASRVKLHSAMRVQIDVDPFVALSFPLRTAGF